MKSFDNRKAIDNLYRNIAIKDSLNAKEDSKELETKIALSLGYTLEDLESGANLGLGCGNPIQNANLKEGETVLDLGCGKGMDVFKACKIVGETGLVIGVDRLPEMVEKANYIREKKKLFNTDFRVSDIDNLKVEDNTVDCVISNCVINLCEDKEKVYSEIFRVLKPGGRICIITFHSLEDRIVKVKFKENENPCTCPPNFPVCVCGKVSKGKVITRKPIIPSEEEIEVNKRAKSSKLRIFERR